MKRCLAVFLWTIAASILIEPVIVQVSITLIFSGYDLLSSSFPIIWAFANIIIPPVLIAVFSVLEHRGGLPRMYMAKDKIGPYPALLLSSQAIGKGFGKWSIFGLLPFIAYIVLFAGHERFLFFLPGAIAYAEISLVVLMYRAMKVPSQIIASSNH